jgi:ppx/gppA phosphatase
MYVIIDIGSNTIRMAVYNIEADNSFSQIMSNKVSCGIAGYISDNEMSAEGVEVMIDALKQFRIAVDGMSNVKVFAIATASIRELTNKKEIVERIKSEVGFEVDVISGQDEAIYDYYGIMKDIGDATGMLTDCGGGSTELSLFNGDEILFADTMPIGSLNAYHRHVEGIFPTEEELLSIKKDTEKMLEKLQIPVDIKTSPGHIYAIGGTVRATCKLANKLFDRSKSTSTLNASEYDKLFDLYFKDQKKFIRTLLKVKPERVQSLVTGMCIQKTIMDKLGCDEITVSESGVREGFLMNKLEEMNKN